MKTIYQHCKSFTTLTLSSNITIYYCDYPRHLFIKIVRSLQWMFSLDEHFSWKKWFQMFKWKTKSVLWRTKASDPEPGLLSLLIISNDEDSGLRFFVIINICGFITKVLIILFFTRLTYELTQLVFTHSLPSKITTNITPVPEIGTLNCTCFTTIVTVRLSHLPISIAHGRTITPRMP